MPRRDVNHDEVFCPVCWKTIMDRARAIWGHVVGLGVDQRAANRMTLEYLKYEVDKKNDTLGGRFVDGVFLPH